MAEFDSPAFRPNNWAQADLAESLATQRPVSAQPINIPLGELKPNPPNSPRRMSSLERSVALQEQAARDAEFKAQRERELQRQQEVFKNEQARRDALRNRTPTAEPPTPRITDRNPAWEQPTPTSKSPTQPGTPNPASLPPTPNSSGARPSAKISPTAHPAQGVLVQELPPPISKPPTMPPSSLPKPAAGIYGGAAIGAGIDAGFRIISGQPPAQVGFGAGGSFAGSVAGALVGSAFGPAGTFVGGMIGGYLGGMIGDAIYRAAFPPAATPPQSQPFSGKVEPNYGSAVTGYRITFWALQANGQRWNDLVISEVWGPLESFVITNSKISVIAHGDYINGHPSEYSLSTKETVLITGFSNDFVGMEELTITRLDGGVDPPGQPQPIPADNRTPGSYFHPGNQAYAPPTGTPQSKPNPAPNNYGVGGIAPGGTARGDKWDWLPHGFPAPKQSPNPNTNPGNLGGELPGTSPSPTPSGNPGTSPNGGDQSFPSPTIISTDAGPSPKPRNFGDSNAQPVPLGSGGSVTISGPSTKPPNGLPGTGKKEPTPDATSPTPKNQDPTKPSTQIPPLFIPAAPTTKPLDKDETKAAVCELTAPDACIGSPLNNIQNTADQNSNKLDQLNALLNTLDLAGLAQLNSKLDLVNNKLGAQVPGGITGYLGRIAKWMHLDRVLNILIWWQTLHNAYMLSANLGQTLTSAISNVLAAIGLKDEDGSPLDIGEILGGQFDNLAKSVIGESEWGSIKAEWKKWNRIYQAAANLMNSIQSIGYSILGALEVVGSWVASIGNALRKFGEVADNAYRWMNPTPNFQNKFFTTLENTENVISQIDTVASEVLSVQETVTQIGEQKEQFTKALSEDEGSKQGTEPPEATKIKGAFDASKLVSATGLAISDDDKEADE